MTQFKLTGFQLNNLQRIAEEASQKKRYYIYHLHLTANYTKSRWNSQEKILVLSDKCITNRQ